jgi:hypothetical protein
VPKPTPGNPNWKIVTGSVFGEALSTGQLQPIELDRMPAWTREAPTVTGAWASGTSFAPAGSTSDLSTSRPNVRGFVERQHRHAPTHRYDRYIYVKLVDGRVFQSGPYKDVEFGHHHTSRPPWLEESVDGDA